MTSPCFSRLPSQRGAACGASSLTVTEKTDKLAMQGRAVVSRYVSHASEDLEFEECQLGKFCYPSTMNRCCQYASRYAYSPNTDGPTRWIIAQLL